MIEKKNKEFSLTLILLAAQMLKMRKYVTIVRGAKLPSMSFLDDHT